VTGATRFFSPDYATARARFRSAARAAGATLDALPLDARGPRGEALAIDIAWLGERRAGKVLLHMSGLHGIEAFAGSAIQLALLERPPLSSPDGALVLVHVLNPFGMAWLRRANENNVDLNRNFLAGGEAWSGAPRLYRCLDSFLNPPSAPHADFFYLKAVRHVLRYGFGALKQAVAEGQYEFPKGLFFGGHELEPGPRLFLRWIADSLGSAHRIVAIDVHTGLGPWGEETLLAESHPGGTPLAQLAAALQRNLIDVSRDAAIAYRVRGSMGQALCRLLPKARIEFVLQELGTRSPLVVLRALREENRWHHYGDGRIDHPAKKRLREALCPASPRWRERVLAKGVALAGAAARWIFRDVN
jgi:hypothetical protein